MSKRKLDGKSFSDQKRKRRQWLTTLRMVRYGVNNFSRNAWLTIAATAIMTITLMIVFFTFAARNTLVTTVDVIKDNVDMSIYLKTEVKPEAVNTITGDLLNLESVERVTYISAAEARKNFAEENSTDSDTLDALNEAVNKIPATVRIGLADINDTSELTRYVENNETYKANADPDRDPSFKSDRRDAIKTIGTWVSVADRAGIVGSIIFVSISMLIVFNTIRMAIFNRKDEIEMMKLIGADKNFIRGPFLVEAVMYGFIAAVVATGLGMAVLVSQQGRFLDYGIAILPTIDFLMTYIGFVLLVMIILGGLIGVISSLFATRRYLKI